MKPVVVICAGIVLLVAIYLVTGTDERSEVAVQPAELIQAEPVEAMTSGPIALDDVENSTEDLAREADELQSGTATELYESGLSPSQASTERGLDRKSKSLHGEETRKASATSNLDDASRWVPRDWSLGSPTVTASVGSFYEMESDFDTVLDGGASVAIRSVQPVEREWTAGIGQIVDAETYRGQRLKYSGFLRIQRLVPKDVSSAMLWIRADDESGRVVAFQNTSSQFVPQEAEWSEATIIIDIPETASAIFIGASLIGGGSAWVDRLSLEPVDLSYPTMSPPYDKQTFNRVPDPVWVLALPSNLSFEQVIPLPES